MAWWLRTSVRVLGTLCLLTWLQAVAFASGPPAEKIVIVADSRRFSGWRAWWMDLYNESHLAFAILTIVIIPLLGLVLGTLTDRVMGRLGINLKSRVLAEH